MSDETDRLECVIVPQDFLDLPVVKDFWEAFNLKTEWTSQSGVFIKIKKGQLK